HTRNFETLVNTAVSVKEMVHRTFKDLYVTENPHTFMSEQEFKVENDGLSKRLDDKHPLFQNLSRSYLEYFESKATLLNRK
ncbi:14795_t:CDS:2, partial [Funneliformis geosporum]